MEAVAEIGVVDKPILTTSSRTGSSRGGISMIARCTGSGAVVVTGGPLEGRSGVAGEEVPPAVRGSWG